MSIGSIIGGGIQLVRTRPQVVAIWAALYFAATLVIMIAVRPLSAAMLAYQQQAAAGVALPAFPPGWAAQFALMELVFVVLLVIAFAAVVRAVTRPSDDRFAYIRLGMDELRLIGLGFLLVIAFIIAEVVAVVGGLLVGMLIRLVAGNAVAILAGVIMVIALFCAAIYAHVRLSLTGALTVMRGRIVIREAWRATKGHFWMLSGAYLLLAVGILVASLIFIALTNPHLLAAYARFDMQGILALGQEQMARQSAGLSIGLIAQAIASAILMTVTGAVYCGAVATAALELSPADVPEQ